MTDETLPAAPEASQAATPAIPAELKAVETVCLTLDDDTDPDTIDEIMSRLKWIGDEYDRVKKMFDQAVIHKIKAKGDVLLSNNRRLYVAGGAKKYKPRSSGKLLEAILLMSGGDMGAVENVLSANWIKSTEIRNLCEDTPEDQAVEIADKLQLGSQPKLFDKLIDTVFGPDKLEEGKPERLTLDTGYRRKPAAKKAPLNRGEYLK